MTPMVMERKIKIMKTLFVAAAMAAIFNVTQAEETDFFRDGIELLELRLKAPPGLAFYVRSANGHVVAALCKAFEPKPSDPARTAEVMNRTGFTVEKRGVKGHVGCLFTDASGARLVQWIDTGNIEKVDEQASDPTRVPAAFILACDHKDIVQRDQDLAMGCNFHNRVGDKMVIWENGDVEKIAGRTEAAAVAPLHDHVPGPCEGIADAGNLAACQNWQYREEMAKAWRRWAR
jgi:hypothetical protein